VLLPALLLLLQAAPVPVPADVVVVARKRKCDVSVANRIVSDAEFRRRAAEWAGGTPVRVSAPTSADYKCLARIVLKLNEYGVTRVIFAP
jgi:hypothetical protein